MTKKQQSSGRQVKAIIPARFNEKALLDVLQSELRKYAPFFVRSFEGTVRFWKGKRPKFQAAVKVTKTEYSIQVKVTGTEEAKKKWHFLDQGTRPHVIRPRRAKVLRFKYGGPGSYQAGSKADSTFVIEASNTATQWVSKKFVKHPGFPARNFGKLIAAEHQKPFQRWMEAAMGNAAAASNHEVKK